jgi:hypothetical protein
MKMYSVLKDTSLFVNISDLSFLWISPKDHAEFVLTWACLKPVFGLESLCYLTVPTAGAWKRYALWRASSSMLCDHLKRSHSTLNRYTLIQWVYIRFFCARSHITNMNTLQVNVYIVYLYPSCSFIQVFLQSANKKL